MPHVTCNNTMNHTFQLKMGYVQAGHVTWAATRSTDFTLAPFCDTAVCVVLAQFWQIVTHRDIAVRNVCAALEDFLKTSFALIAPCTKELVGVFDGVGHLDKMEPSPVLLTNGSKAISM